MYRFNWRSTVIASALLIAVGGAWAQSSPSVRLDLSQDAVKFLYKNAVEVTEAGPGVLEKALTPRGAYASLALTVPIRAETLGDAVQGGMPSLVQTQGGMYWSSVLDTPWAHGNDFYITNLTVDGEQGRILADLEGPYSFGAKAQVPVWTFNSAEVTAPGGGGSLGQTVLRGLSMTEEARLLTVQALYLESLPASDLTRARIADWGTLTVGVAMAVVPEPSSAVLMSLAFAGLLVAVRRQRLRCNRVA